MEQNRIRVAVLAELGRIWWTWQNIAECGRLPLDCRRLPLDCRLMVSLFLLRRWKQVDVCKVLRRSPVIVPPFKLELLRDGAEVVLGRVCKSLLRLI